jgi:hypothetical protein
LYLDSISPNTTIEEVKANTGFTIFEETVPIIMESTREELSLIKRIDPKGVRYKEFSK